MRANPLIFLAEWTGLEPATPGVTGRYSNQLNYHSLRRKIDYSMLFSQTTSNYQRDGASVPAQAAATCSAVHCSRNNSPKASATMGRLIRKPWNSSH